MRHAARAARPWARYAAVAGAVSVLREAPASCEMRMEGRDWPAEPLPGLRRQRSPPRHRFAVESAARCVSKSLPRKVQPPVMRGAVGGLGGEGQDHVVLGVADGVSSWARYGVNPALFAWELMVRCEEQAEKGHLEARDRWRTKLFLIDPLVRMLVESDSLPGERSHG
eukprot:Skav229398  [mRNA]  locus=scaffold904:138882:143631:+ [translate_table: standard]